ncbi:MAG: flagellar hook-basal body protein [Bacteroidota bacterium]
MLKGIYAAASGMNFQLHQVETISENLANANTTGYQKVELLGKSFGDFVAQMDKPSPVGLGVQIDGLARYNRPGHVRITNNPLNVALQSEGYFLVRNQRGQEVLTRNGNFQLSPDSYLQTQSGEWVLDTNRNRIRIEGNTELVSVHGNGQIYQGEDDLGRLLVVNPPAETLTDFPLAPGGLQEARNSQVRHKALEESNVEIIGEMVALMSANRAYGFAQKAINTQDNVLNKTANDLGRVQ